MADIIGSSKKPGDKLMDHFKKLIEKTNKEFKARILSPLTITLGDEFQGVMDSLKSSLELIFYLEEGIIEHQHGFKLRYVINYGEIETSINKNIAYEMLGDGLTHARKKLNNSKSENSQRIHVSVSNKKSEMLNKAFYIYQSVLDDWKTKDYIDIHAFLKNKDYKKVADIINKNRSTTWRRQKTLKINEYFAVKDLITLIAD